MSASDIRPDGKSGARRAPAGTVVAATSPDAGARRFEIRFHAGLEAIEPLWRGFEREGVCTAYQRFDWVSAIARHLVPGSGGELLIAEVREADTGRPLMLWPLLRRRGPGYTVVEWLSCGVCDYSAPVMAPGFTPSSLEVAAVWQRLIATLPRTDLIRIDGIPAEMSGLANPLALLAQTVPSQHSSSGLALHGDPDTLLTRVCRRSFVRDFAKFERRLKRRGDLRFVTASTPDEAEALFSVLHAQRLARFRKLGRFDLLTQPDAADFYRDSARRGLTGGPMRVVGLRVGDSWVAILTGLLHGATFYANLIAIGDDSWRNTSPGLQIIARTMLWSCEQGLEYFDLTVGALRYKTEMGAQGKPLFAITQALTFKGRLVVLAMQAIEAGKAWLQAHPKLFDRLRSVRRTLRRARQAIAN